MENIKVLVSLAEMGNFTATAHKITDKGVLFIFDEVHYKQADEQPENQ